MSQPESPHMIAVFGYEERPARCPSCGRESKAVRISSTQAFKATHCAVCVEKDRMLEAAEQRKQLVEERLATLDVPALYADTTLDTFELHGDAVSRELLARAKAFAESYVTDWPDVPSVCVFAGGCGTGKGHLAWSIAKALAGGPCVLARVVVLSDVIRDLREAWKEADGPTEAQRLTRYRSAELLVIDEVSRHAFYGQPQQHLYDLVAWREVRLRPTILTTNELGEGLAQVLGPALSSRAASGFVEFGGADYRLTQRFRRDS